MSIINESKNNISLINEAKSGSGWLYDQSNITYDGEFDSISGMPVYYDGIGTAVSFTNESKNNVTFTGEDKNNV